MDLRPLGPQPDDKTAQCVPMRPVRPSVPARDASDISDHGLGTKAGTTTARARRGTRREHWSRRNVSSPAVGERQCDGRARVEQYRDAFGGLVATRGQVGIGVEIADRDRLGFGASGGADSRSPCRRCRCRVRAVPDTVRVSLATARSGWESRFRLPIATEVGWVPTAKLFACERCRRPSPAAPQRYWRRSSR